MNNHIFFILLFLISLFVYTSKSQNTPILLGGTCETLTQDSVCFKYLNYTSYYLPPNSTFESVNKTASNLLNLLDLTTNECKSNATYLFCLQYFPKCNIIEETLSNNTVITFYLPSLPCNSVCLLSESPCKLYIEKYFKTLTCNSTYTDGMPMFPNNNTIYELDQENQYNFNASVQCIGQNELIKQNDSEIIINCPAPLLNAKDYVIEGKDLYYYVTDYCIIDCPFQVYPKSKMDRLDAANWTLTIISFISCTFLIITFGILPNKITHRMESILSFALGAWLTGLSLFIQSADDDFSCSRHDRGRFKSQSDHLCLFVGLLFQLGAIISIFWCPMIAYEVYLNSKMKKLKHFDRYRKIFWPTLIILTALPAFGGKYGATVATTGCWITSDNGGVWQYISFYIPSFISMALITLFSVLSVINITKMYLKTPNKWILFFNVKIVFTIIILLFDLTFAASLKFYMEERMDEFFNSVYVWANCISTTVGDKSHCVLNAPGYDFKALNVVVVSILGLTVFLGFGIDPLVITIWSESTKLKWLLNKLGLNKFIHFSNSSTTASSSSNQHNSNEIDKRKNSHVPKKIKLNSIKNNNNNSTETNSSDSNNIIIYDNNNNNSSDIDNNNNNNNENNI